MDKHDKRQLALKQIKNTLIKCAQIDNTCDLNKLIGEICRIYGVSTTTAKGYIKELENLGIAKTDIGLIWYTDDEEIRNIYLENINNEEKGDNKMEEWKAQYKKYIEYAQKNLIEYREGWMAKRWRSPLEFYNIKGDKGVLVDRGDRGD